MKNFFYYFLICTIVISTLGLSSNLNVNAASASSFSNVIEKNDEKNRYYQEADGYYNESFELNGVQYYYEDTEKYTITIIKTLDSEENIAYKEKNGKDDEIYIQYKPEMAESKNKPTVIYGIDKEITLLNPADIKELEIIKHKVLNNEIVLEKKSILHFATVTDLTESEDISLFATGTAGINKVNYSLSSSYGPQYVNNHIGTMLKSGVTAYLYASQTFGVSLKKSFLFNALTAIGIVSTAVSTSISGLLGIASWASAGAGAYSLVKKTDFTQWNAKIYRQKEVKVGTVYPYRAFFDRKLTAVTGTQGYAALSSATTTFKNSDYDNNTSLLNTGINNYLLYH